MVFYPSILSLTFLLKHIKWDLYVNNRKIWWCYAVMHAEGQGNSMCACSISVYHWFSLLHNHCLHFGIKCGNQFHISSVPSCIHTYTNQLIMFKVDNQYIHVMFVITNIIFKFQIVLACVLVTICHSQKPYVDPEAGNPKPFTYQYAVADDYSKANFQKTESQDPKVRPSSSCIENHPFVIHSIISGKCQRTVCDCPTWRSYPDNLLHR